MLHAFQIAAGGCRRDSRGMMQSWLVRLNDFLTWLNPALGLIATVLAAMVVAEAVDRLPMPPARPTFAVAQVVRQKASATCPPASLPPEWRELSRYD